MIEAFCLGKNLAKRKENTYKHGLLEVTRSPPPLPAPRHAWEAEAPLEGVTVDARVPQVPSTQPEPPDLSSWETLCLAL